MITYLTIVLACMAASVSVSEYGEAKAEERSILDNSKNLFHTHKPTTHA